MQEPIMQFFEYSHLPESLQKVSSRFAELATIVVDSLPRSSERTVALRKLLESKDAAVRAAVMKMPTIDSVSIGSVTVSDNGTGIKL